MLVRANRRGASLIEFMTVVALMCVLAGIASTAADTLVLVAKRSEVCDLVDGIKSAEILYQMLNDGFIATPMAPRDEGALDGTLVEFEVASYPEWLALGWRPDGDVRCAYQVDLDGTSDFVVTGTCDVDNDDVVAIYRATRWTNCAMDPASAGVY